MQVSRVLVFPCGTEIGLELYRALRLQKDVVPCGASSASDHGEMVWEHYEGGLPFVGAPDFKPRIAELVERWEIDALMGAHDAVLVAFEEMKADGMLPGGVVVGSGLETSRICRSKSATYELLRDAVPVPRTWVSLDDVPDWPVFLKPDAGQGSRGAKRCDAREEAEVVLAAQPDSIVCEYLPGPEYTVDCLTDHEGRLRFAAGRERVRVREGISVRTAEVTDPRFEELAARINDRLRLRGAWFYQVKERRDGEFVLMEVAPRPAGTSGYQRLRGVNLPLLSLYVALGRPVRVLPSALDLRYDRALYTRVGVAERFSAAWVDLDDTLLMADGRLNHALLGLLYRWRDDGWALHLLSRHRARFGETLRDALRRVAIARNLFDSLVDVEEGERKSASIDQVDGAIFIDDSFSERADVSDVCGIPAFDVGQVLELFNAEV